MFIEGPTVDLEGNLFITDIPHGQILKVDRNLMVTRCVKYDGEPNGMALRADGKLVVADYKKVASHSDRIPSLTQAGVVVIRSKEQ